MNKSLCIQPNVSLDLPTPEAPLRLTKGSLPRGESWVPA
jgi:hypothetical protein